MSRSPSQIQTVQITRTVARLERAKETPVAGQPGDGAIENPVSFMDIGRRQRGPEYYMLFQVGHSGASTGLVENNAAIRRQHPLPIMMRPQIWRVYQDVNRVPARRSNGGIGAGWRCDITGRIRGRLAFAVDPVKFFLGVRRKDKVMMGQLLVYPIESKIQNNAGTGGIGLPSPAEACGRLAADKFAIGADGIHIRNDGSQADGLACICLDSGDLPAVGQDSADTGPQPQIDTQIVCQRLQSLWHRARAAHWIPNPTVSLHVRNSAQHGRRTVRRRTDI